MKGILLNQHKIGVGIVGDSKGTTLGQIKTADDIFAGTVVEDAYIRNRQGTKAFYMICGTTPLIKASTSGGNGVTILGRVAFNSKVPAAAPNYTLNNPVAVRRTLDATAGTATEVREVLATLVQDLIDIGLLQ